MKIHTTSQASKKLFQLNKNVIEYKNLIKSSEITYRHIYKLKTLDPQERIFFSKNFKNKTHSYNHNKDHFIYTLNMFCIQNFEHDLVTAYNHVMFLKNIKNSSSNTKYQNPKSQGHSFLFYFLREGCQPSAQ